MDTKLMIHLAVEATVLSGMTIYFRGKVNTLEEENNKLKAENNVLKSIIIEHDKMISLICQRIEIPFKSPILQQQQRQLPPQQDEDKQKKSKKTTKKQKEEIETDEEEGYDTEDLDSELKDEIEEIKKDEKREKGKSDIKREKGG
jgi:hypothetical protein